MHCRRLSGHYAPLKCGLGGRSSSPADDEPAQTNPQTPWVNRWVEIEPSRPKVDARWVDIAQVDPPSIERKRAPMVSPHVVLLVFITIVIALTLATIEFMFRRAVYWST
jgi:hypothetical protein